ncbi:hypothetical protein AB1Y20_014786 [Prymnesium parvum]|uniref:Uncharacterized protein n=1 Tax=Prymnesium parvum TaxID=97485 RepID=A0AB34IEA6_PRYPA|eukprot:CAMPEP_0182824620 /NCGR_PEP_ID=MMETSP0006_2-20121128/15389_1 /TAXON_ID=97485 /ORGANISM="Prymnesium parvum, Strain Texoma1" /LENGTH=127 /DNA_ID=CAMNT_0024951633 /DNA_START=64 /DNA_END=447 /DNA_ORIENTATION=-
MAFEAHANWVRSLHDAYRSRPDVMLTVSAGSSIDTEFPSHERIVNLDLDAPAYRGAPTGSFEYFDAEVDVDQPVYRSIGGFDSAAAGESVSSHSFDLGSSGFADEPMDSEWLAAMPPLLHRQVGRRA